MLLEELVPYKRWKERCRGCSQSSRLITKTTWHYWWYWNNNSVVLCKPNRYRWSIKWSIANVTENNKKFSKKDKTLTKNLEKSDNYYLKTIEKQDLIMYKKTHLYTRSIATKDHGMVSYSTDTSRIYKNDKYHSSFNVLAWYEKRRWTIRQNVWRVSTM